MTTKVVDLFSAYLCLHNTYEPNSYPPNYGSSSQGGPWPPCPLNKDAYGHEGIFGLRRWGRTHSWWSPQTFFLICSLEGEYISSKINQYFNQNSISISMILTSVCIIEQFPNTIFIKYFSYCCCFGFYIFVKMFNLSINILVECLSWLPLKLSLYPWLVSS